ncbi:helix-turn-helix domain-containing protein [Fusobacterium sp. PH5-44]|uniref:helix-turn-helix domain-containing protein n=1 Tax=unclassified Fusobacterium TaxID=2648384 RepID=UPI003D1BE322
MTKEEKKINRKSSEVVILLTNKISKKFADERKKRNFTRLELAYKLGITLAQISGIENGKIDAISKVLYEKFLNFFGNKENYNKDSDRIVLTKRIINDLRSQREKRKYSRPKLAKELGVKESSIATLERGERKTIPKELYEKYLNFFTNKENYNKDIDRIILTEEIINDLRTQREKRKYSRPKLAKELGVNESSIITLEKGARKTIPKELYEKYLNFFANKENYNKDIDRIILTKKIINDLRNKRVKMRYSRSELAKALEEKENSVATIEKGIRKTIPKELYEKYLNFFGNKENYNKDSDRIVLTKRIINDLRSQREKRKYSRPKLAKELGVKESSIATLEKGEKKTIPKELYEKYLNFFTNKENYNKDIDRIILTEEIINDLRSQREKRKYSRPKLAKELGVNESSIIALEKGTRKTIPKELYEKYLNFFGNKENYNKDIDRIILTKEIIDRLKKEREKRKYSRSGLAKIFGVKEAIITKMETGNRKTISKELYEKYLEFCANQRNYNKIDFAIRNGNIPMTVEMAKSLKIGREKRGFSRREIEWELGIDRKLLLRVENGNAKSFSKELYDKLLAFYKDHRNQQKDKVRVIITDKIRKFFIKRRKQLNFTQEQVNNILHLSYKLVKGLEHGGLKSIPRYDYIELINFYTNKSNKKKSRNKERIPVTDEMIKLLIEKRKEKGYTYSELGRKLDFRAEIFYNVERGVIKTVPVDIYNKLFDFYRRTRVKKVEARITLTDEVVKIFRDKREKLGLSQKHISDEVGVFRTYIGRIESGKVETLSKQVYKKLIKILQIEVDEDGETIETIST